MRALPEAPSEACDKLSAKVSSTALVRYRMNDYSAPAAYGFRDVLVKGFVDEVIALTYPFEPLHFFLLEKMHRDQALVQE